MYLEQLEVPVVDDFGWNDWHLVNVALVAVIQLGVGADLRDSEQSADGLGAVGALVVLGVEPFVPDNLENPKGFFL